MIAKFWSYVTDMPVASMIENSAVFCILVLALVVFFRSSSPLTRYFIPIVCVFAVLLRIIHWAQMGGEPDFITPVVSIVASWLS